MSLSIQKLVSDGTLSTIVLGVQYLQRNDMYVRIAGVETPQSGAPSGYAWSFLDNNTIRVLPVVPAGVEVVVYRRTDLDAMYNVYSQNAQFDESTIDENNQQLLYIAQEYFEQGVPAQLIESVEYVREDTTNMYYRLKLSDGKYTTEFPIPKGGAAGFEALRRVYLEAGLNLVAGSFETGGVLSNTTDVLLHNITAKAYAWSGTFPKVVNAGSTPTPLGSGGWVDRSNVTLRGELSNESGESLIGYYTSISALRSSLSLTVGGKVRVASWHDGWAAQMKPPIGGGIFIVTSDTVTADNGGTVIVNASGQRLYRVLDGGESVDSFGAIADYNVTTGTGTDNSLSIQNALNAGFGKLNGKYGVGSTITLSSGKLWSDDAIPYYASMQYYGATKEDYEGSAICALSTFSSALPLVKTAIGNKPSSANDSSHYGAELQNVVLDAAGYAKHGLSHDYDGRPMRDRQLMLDSVLISGSVSHGMVAANVIAIRSRNLQVSACNGFSVYHAYGVTDCQHSGMYLHTSNGGVYFGDGCVENQFHGGKFEDLYDLPISSIGSGSGKNDFHGVSLVNNNTTVAKASGTSSLRLFDCNIDNPKFGSLNALLAEGGGAIDINNSVVAGYATAFRSDNATINVGPGCNVTTAAWASTVNNGYVVVKSKGEVKSVSLLPSSTINIDFVGALPKMSGGYFKYAELDFDLLYSNFPQSPDAGQSASCKLIFGQAGSSIGVAVKPLWTPNAAYISSVAASIVDGTTIRITVVTGASIGTGGGTGSAIATIKA